MTNAKTLREPARHATGNLRPPPPVALTIGGSDSCAGAGIQADLKTFTACGVFGLTAVTSVVAETPHEVRNVHSVHPKVLEDQLALLLDSYPVVAVKTGMLSGAPLIRIAARMLTGRGIPLVVDPVMIASCGDPLIDAQAVDALVAGLLPLAALVTPNLDEAGVLLNETLEPDSGLDAAAQRLFNKIGRPVLLKGGHSTGPAIDFLADASGCKRFSARRVAGASAHGTGCTLSAAITAFLARGLSLEDAVSLGKRFVTRALQRRHQWPNSIEALDQSIRMR